MAKIRYFLRSEFGTECDACGRRFDVSQGGACVRCGRILCSAHLHGSWLRRMRVDLGAAPTCVDCRAGRPVPDADSHHPR
jgi:hypothetical protein